MTHRPIVYSAVQYISQQLSRDERNRRRYDANLGPHTPQSDALTTRPLRPAESLQTAELRVCIDPPRVTALTLPARCRALPPPADMDRKAAAIDGTQGQIDGRTPER